MKVLFTLPHMRTGGIQTALLSMFEHFPVADGFDVTVAAGIKEGELLGKLPETVRVVPIDGFSDFAGKNGKAQIITALKKFRFIKALIVLFAVVLRIVTKNDAKSMAVRSLLSGKPKEKYDVAVSFGPPSSESMFFTACRVNAAKKVLWIHADVSEALKKPHEFADTYARFDKIYCVSDYAKSVFDGIYPALKEKTAVYRNIVDAKSIVARAQEKPAFPWGDGVKILTVARVGHEKGTDLALESACELARRGVSFCWLVLGGGEDLNKLKALAREKGIDGKFRLVGNAENPFPLMKDCDIYVQPSRNEGYCLTLAEIRCFGKAIVSTDFPAACEHITNGKTGIICKTDAKSIADAVFTLCSNESARISLAENCKRAGVSENENIWKILKNT